MIEGIQSGIDWLSLTAPREMPGLSNWKGACTRAIGEIAKQGYVLETRKMQGYEGISAGNCFFGEREDGFFCQLTGFHANDWFEQCYHPKCNVPRIDLQFTAKFDVMPANIAKKGYHDATLANSGLPVTRRRKMYIIVGSDGGDTLYIGSPSSEQRGRLYNKAVQSELPEYARSWRYEVVLRNELARNCAQQLPRASVERADYVLTLVCAWYEVRGVDCGLYHTGEKPPLPLQRALPTDVERKLDWLNSQVKPTIRYLCSLGFRDTLLRELFPDEASENV